MIETDIDVYMNELTKKIIAKIDSFEHKNALVSVILTGSLGRDEGTFHRTSDDARLVLDSDVEIALVYKKGKKEFAEKIKENLITDFIEEMNPMTISENRVRHGYNFNYSILKPKKSSIFMYDLYNGSKTIWGEDLLKRRIPKYDKFEAKRIVANRIGELTYLKEVVSIDKLKETKNQWEAKLMLAIGSAYCILDNAYESKYESQRNYLINQKCKLNNIFDENFIIDYENAYLYLRKNEGCYGVSGENLRNYVEEIDLLFSQNELNFPAINSLSRNLKYMIACIKSKANLNPLTCETDILDKLIKEFTVNDKNLIETAINWKEIIY